MGSITIDLEPTLGRVAVAPAGEEAYNGLWPGNFGGNMDSPDVREGTTVYLPIFHDGAYFYFGDGHARQGDGVIITWPLKSHKTESKSVNCYFEMTRLLEKRKAHYQSAYGETPRIRAGIHSGPVVATWVGEAKRELALHGDVLYVSARIQSLCKEYNADCLVSNQFLESTKLPSRMVTKDLGEVVLRGRESGVRLHSISEE